DVSSLAPAWQRVRVSFADIKAGVSAQLVSKLTEAFITQPKIQSERLRELVVVLCKCGCLPRSKFTIGETKVISGSKYITNARMIVARTKAQQKIGPAEKLQE